METLRDPITEWEVAIERRMGKAVICLMLFAFVCCLVAPAFGPLIKRFKRRQYVMAQNFEELAERDMKSIRKVLWAVSIVSWILLIWMNYFAPY